MKDRTIIHMINESNRIYRALIWYTAVLVGGIVVIARPETVNNPFLFGLGLAAIVVSLVAIALNILLVNGLNRNGPPSVPYGGTDDEWQRRRDESLRSELNSRRDPADASDILDFPTEHRVTSGRLEDHSKPNSIGLGRFDLSRNEWRRLAVMLSGANWVWNRRLLQRTAIWEGLTANNRYNIVTDDFEKIGAVHTTRDDRGKILKARVTSAGREGICKLAATPLL